MVLESFPPCVDIDARILILGSMPGRASLEAQRYYAHPRNQFWWIMSELLKGSMVDVSMPEDYPERLAWLRSHQIGLWDVLKFCERDGSLDSNIKVATEVANPLPELIETLRSLQLVIFNGKKAEQAFKRYCADSVINRRVKFVCLPSSSPANAATSKECKLEQWSNAIRRYG